MHGWDTYIRELMSFSTGIPIVRRQGVENFRHQVSLPSRLQEKLGSLFIIVNTPGPWDFVLMQL